MFKFFVEFFNKIFIPQNILVFGPAIPFSPFFLSPAPFFPIKNAKNISVFEN